jgi:hypothetical protein
MFSSEPFDVSIVMTDPSMTDPSTAVVSIVMTDPFSTRF